MKGIEVTALDLAKRFIGLKEAPGHASSAGVLAMLQLDHSTIQDDEVPWCSAFVNYVAWLLGLPRTKSLAARSWLSLPTVVAPDDWQPGFDVVIFKRGTGPQPGPEVLDAPGHVAFLEGVAAYQVYVVGGNQGDAVTEAPFLRSSILGVRRLLV